MICVIDNYDSFTYNLVQILLKNKLQVQVFKNDEVELQKLKDLEPKIQAFLLSPGPGHPQQSGICRDLVSEFHQRKPILGVCLGHQILADFFGGKIQPSPRIMHGKISEIEHDGKKSYHSIPPKFKATRYHSLIVDFPSLPESLEPTSWTTNSNGERYELMGFRHRKWPLEGVQFHPESVLTPYGEVLIMNFLSQNEIPLN